MKKNHQKNASHLKNNKNSSHSKRYKKDIEKVGMNEKQKVREKFNNVTTTTKLFTLIFRIWKRIYFCSKTYFGKM